jgi:UDP-glucuronate decarboxylase
MAYRDTVGVRVTRAPRRRILVPGGAGFVGSHLCERLLGLGHDVVCLDSLLTGRTQNIARLIGHPRFEFARHDVTEPFDLGAFDQIYNLACAASPPAYQRDPIHTLKTNVLGALAVLDLARRCGATVLQASTSEIYGDPDVHPQVESYWGNVNPIGPRACYDEGKRCAETIFFDYARQYGVSIRVARIFNTYGPRMRADDGRVVSNFIVQALTGEPITVYGGGEQTRSLCYVDDLVDGLIRLMNNAAEVQGPINLGNPDEYSVAEIADIVCRMTGSRSPVVHRELPVDDPRRRRPDISAARESLGWQPKVSLLTGLARTIEHFRSELATLALADAGAAE